LATTKLKNIIFIEVARGPKKPEFVLIFNSKIKFSSNWRR